MSSGPYDVDYGETRRVDLESHNCVNKYVSKCATADVVTRQSIININNPTLTCGHSCDTEGFRFIFNPTSV